MRKLLSVAFCITLVFSGGCATPVPPKTVEPKSFEVAVREMTDRLFAQVQHRWLGIGGLLGAHVVIDPFIDANTAEVNSTSRRIEVIVLDEAKKRFPRVAFEPMTAKGVDEAKYLLTGIIKYERLPGGGPELHYKIAASVIELKSGLVIANSENWISERNLDITPVAIYQGSPMYLKDQRIEGQVITAQANPGESAEKTYFNSLSTAALLSEGDTEFEKKDFEKALGYYKSASLRSDGQTMKSFAALYQVYRKLNRPDEAEVAFGRLVTAGFQTKNISAKLLFSVASTDFISDLDLRAQYNVWLRQIARTVAKSEQCVDIVGHSSRTGAEEYNNALSTQRSIQVQKMMQRDYPQVTQRTKAYGRGWKENIVGSGTDDIRDAIDRRVEFKIVDCGK